MKKRIFLLMFVGFLVCGTYGAIGDSWNLNADWYGDPNHMDPNNPDGPWSYHQVTGTLFTVFEGWGGGDFPLGEVGWRLPGKPGHLGMSKLVHNSSEDTSHSYSYLAGEICGHTNENWGAAWVVPATEGDGGYYKITGSIHEIRSGYGSVVATLTAGGSQLLSYEMSEAAIAGSGKNVNYPYTFSQIAALDAGEVVDITMSANGNGDFGCIGDFNIQRVGAPECPEIGDIFDLAADWSNTSNPNTPWEYRGKGGLGDPSILLLPLQPNWDAGDFNVFGFGPQPAWSPGVVPSLGSAVDSQPYNGTYTFDIEPGDVFGHAPYMVRWIAPCDTTIKITGNCWKLRGGPGGALNVWLLENGDWGENTSEQRHELAHQVNRLIPTVEGDDTRATPRSLGTTFLDVVAGQKVSILVLGNDFLAINVTIEIISTDTVLLTVNANPGYVDTTVPAPGVYPVLKNQDFQLNANTYTNCANNGEVLVFDSWIGDVANPTSAATTIFMDTDKTVTANYVDGRQCGDICHPYSPYDFTQDCIVNLADMSQFATGWLECTQPACD